MVSIVHREQQLKPTDRANESTSDDEMACPCRYAARSVSSVRWARYSVVHSLLLPSPGPRAQDLLTYIHWVRGRAMIVRVVIHRKHLIAFAALM